MPDSMNNISILRADWTTYHRQIMLIRRTVFIREQGVSEADEVDSMDYANHFVLALDIDSNPIGTARLMANGRVGRMAVLLPYRGRGVGNRMLLELLSIATEYRMQNLFLHAQVYAIPFYEKHGFLTSGPEYMEAGIDHREMHRAMSKHTLR